MGYLTTESVNPVPEWGKSQKAGGNYGTTTILSEHALEISADSNSIPVIDVSNIFSPILEARKAVAAEIREACINVGFFYVQNHGIPQELVDGVFEWGKKFFDLSFEEKMEIYIDNIYHYRGYTPLYGAGTAGSDGKGSRCICILIRYLLADDCQMRMKPLTGGTTAN